MTVGTHAYMAPEQITGDTSISGKADLYSLGCCLFEMLAGRTPFQGDNFAQLFEQHLRSEPPMFATTFPIAPWRWMRSFISCWPRIPRIDLSTPAKSRPSCCSWTIRARRRRRKQP